MQKSTKLESVSYVKILRLIFSCGYLCLFPYNVDAEFGEEDEFDEAFFSLEEGGVMRDEQEVFLGDEAKLKAKEDARIKFLERKQIREAARKRLEG